MSSGVSEGGRTGAPGVNGLKGERGSSQPGAPGRPGEKGSRGDTGEENHVFGPLNMQLTSPDLWQYLKLFKKMEKLTFQKQKKQPIKKTANLIASLTSLVSLSICMFVLNDYEILVFRCLWFERLPW